MRRRTLADKVREWEAGDLEAAMAVLERPETYGGEGSGIVTWARRVVARATPQAPQGGELNAVDLLPADHGFLGSAFPQNVNLDERGRQGCNQSPRPRARDRTGPNYE